MWPIRVYYEDTDVGGIVFFANYLKYFERARTEWLRACGIDQARLADEGGILFVVKNTALDYHAPARLNDILTIVTHVERLGRASVELTQHAWRDDTLLVTSNARVGCVARTTLKPTALHAPVLAALRCGPRAACTEMSTASP